jgi:hypothetical protein
MVRQAPVGSQRRGSGVRAEVDLTRAAGARFSEGGQATVGLLRHLTQWQCAASGVLPGNPSGKAPKGMLRHELATPS